MADSTDKTTAGDGASSGASSSSPRVPDDGFVLDVLQDLHRIAVVCTNPFAHPGAAAREWASLAEKLELALTIAGRIKPEE